MKLRMDTRAQSMGLARFFLALIVGAIMIGLVNRIALDETLPLAKQASNNATANQATVWMQDALSLLPIVLLLISAFGMIAYAVFRREQAR